MVEIRFNGKFILPEGKHPQQFLNEFNRYMNTQKVQITGQMHIEDIEDAEIIEEICTNVEQTEASSPQQTVEAEQQ